MALTDAEKETIVRWDKETDTVIIDTFEVALINKLKKQGAIVLNESKYEGSPYARLQVDRKWIKISKPVVRQDLIGKGVKGNANREG